MTYGDCVPISDKQIKVIEDAALVAIAKNPFGDSKVEIDALLVLKLIEEVLKPKRYDTFTQADNLRQNDELVLLRDVIEAARVNPKTTRRIKRAIARYDAIDLGHEFP